MTQPSHAEPRWQIQAVFDPDGNGADFAYTIGLHELDRPELHVWARPTDGDDPGSDWALSVRDRQILVHRTAEKFVAGQLSVGDTWTEEYDAGATLVHYTLGSPQPRDELDAFGAHPDATVVPIRFRLERAPEGERAPLSADDRRLAEQQLAEIEALTATLAATRTRIPPAPRLARQHADLPDPWDADAPYGPRTALVLARANQVRHASQEILASYAAAILRVEPALSARHVLALTAAAARPAGRTGQLSDVFALASQTWEAVLGPDGQPTRLYRNLVSELGGTMSAAERHEFAHALRSALEHGLAALLTAEAVGDAAPDTWTAAVGPWEYALRQSGLRCHGQLTASEQVHAAAVAALTAQGTSNLLEVFDAVLDIADNDPDGADTLNEASARAIVEGRLPDPDRIRDSALGPLLKQFAADLDDPHIVTGGAGMDLLFAFLTEAADFPEHRRKHIVAALTAVAPALPAAVEQLISDTNQPA